MVPKLGILGVQIDAGIAAMVPGLRMGSGVIVAARTAFGPIAESGLDTGDVIHAVNGVTIITLDALRAAVDKLKPDDPVVIQIERDGKLRYLAFEME
jgi:S1-C subfamily serine protease